MTDIQTALIVGGGIAGPVTAMALQRAGIEATVYEAYASAADGIGGMLGLAPNGLDALAAIDLADPVRRVAEPVSAMIVQSWTGKQLAKFDDPGGKPIMHVVVTRIIKLAARTNSHKAARPIARRLRDVIMPLAMKVAKPEKTAWQYNHHIDWEAPVVAPGTAQLASLGRSREL